MLKIAFIIISTLLAILLLIYKLVICKQKRTSKTSVYVSFITGMMLSYIVCAIILAIYIPEIWNKLILIILGLSPFIIGKFATYEKEKIYSYIQITTIVFGIFYIIIT